MSISEAYALLGNPMPYVSRRTRGNVTTVTVRLKRRGQTLCKVEAERVAPNATWAIWVGRYLSGSLKAKAAREIAREILTDTRGES